MNAPTVLVIDDDPQLHRLIAFHLDDMVGEVCATHVAAEGLKLAKEKNPGVILLDVCLTDGDGLALCRQLKHDPDTKAIPILILSAETDAFTVAKGLDLGAHDFIKKPFAPDDLRARIRSILREPSDSGINLQQGMRLLVIDDDPSIHNLMDFYLIDRALVLHATKPLDGLRLAETEKPDVILLDLRMPRMNGFQVFDALQANPKTSDIPVVFLTSDNHEGRSARALDAGAADYLVKPIVEIELQARLRTAIRRNLDRRQASPGADSA